jgi:hypothetical protein
VKAADLIRNTVGRVVDAVDAELWKIEQREAFRERHVIPPGQEAQYQRRELLRRHTSERDQ